MLEIPEILGFLGALAVAQKDVRKVLFKKPGGGEYPPI